MAKVRVLLGMSGGTDSSVAAMLLQEKGYEVVGLTYRLWSESDTCETISEPSYIIDAEELAHRIGIEHHVLDVREYFYNHIINYFKEEYLAGRTPNPCSKCNVILKWRLLLEQANKLNCTYLSMGHYAKIEKFNDLFYVQYGDDPEKEQSFFLWGLSQEILSRIIFPLGELSKQQVKEYAAKNGFNKVAKQKESIGMCFINGSDYKPFLKSLLNNESKLPGKGNFVDKDGLVVGQHDGFPFYTVGQRRGLGLIPTEPLYITNINPNKNCITLGKRNDLYQSQMEVADYYFHTLNDIKQEVTVRIRYRKQNASGQIKIMDDKRLVVYFIEPEWSIAPGQTAAFYIGKRLIGGGFIVG